jgi:hypothetical protein
MSAAGEDQRVIEWLSPFRQLPIRPPSSFVITRHGDRGRPPSSPSGQELYRFGLAGSFAPVVASPGCWMPTNMVVSSGVTNTPVTSHCLGPTRNRRISPLAGSAHSIWLLPNPAYAPVSMVLPETFGCRALVVFHVDAVEPAEIGSAPRASRHHSELDASPRRSGAWCVSSLTAAPHTL